MRGSKQLQQIPDISLFRFTFVQTRLCKIRSSPHLYSNTDHRAALRHVDVPALLIRVLCRTKLHPFSKRASASTPGSTLASLTTSSVDLPNAQTTKNISPQLSSDTHSHIYESRFSLDLPYVLNAMGILPDFAHRSSLSLLLFLRGQWRAKLSSSPARTRVEVSRLRSIDFGSERRDSFWA